MGLSVSSRPVPVPQRAQGWLLVCHAVVRHTCHVSWHGKVGISRVAVTVSMHTICACTGNVRTQLLLPRFRMQPYREWAGKVNHVTRRHVLSRDWGAVSMQWVEACLRCPGRLRFEPWWLGIHSRGLVPASDISVTVRVCPPKVMQQLPAGIAILKPCVPSSCMGSRSHGGTGVGCVPLFTGF